jgi:hypothetical protein
MSRLNQLGKVIVHRVVGDAGKRNTVACTHLSSGQNNVADGGDDLGVVIERLVKVAETEKDDGVGELLLDPLVLLLEGSHRTQ